MLVKYFELLKHGHRICKLSLVTTFVLLVLNYSELGCSHILQVDFELLGSRRSQMSLGSLQQH